MTEAIYKVGDILEFKSSQYFPACMYNISGPFRALIIRVDDPDYEYVTYRLLLFSKECNNFINRYMSILQKDIITSAKRIGHIDISLLRYEEKGQEEPDYAMFFTAATLAQAADLKNENEKLKAENKDLHEKIINERKIFEQKLACTEKYFDSAAAALYKERCEKLKEENEALRKERDMQKDTMVKAIDKLYEHGFRYSAIADILGLEDGVVASERIKGLNRSAD